MNVSRSIVRQRVLAAARELGELHGGAAQRPLTESHNHAWILQRCAERAGFGKHLGTAVDSSAAVTAYEAAYERAAEGRIAS